MEKWERTHRRGSPSFSASLLDAIYRSIDDNVNSSSSIGNRGTCRCTNRTDHYWERSEPDLYNQSITTFNFNSRDYGYRNIYKPQQKQQLQFQQQQRARYFQPSTSSESSFGGFSSSDAESQVLPFRRRLSQIHPPPVPQPTLPEHKKVKKESSMSKIYCGMKSSKSKTKSKAQTKTMIKAPSFPGRRLACFLNTLCASGGDQKKPRSSPPPATINSIPSRTIAVGSERSTGINRYIVGVDADYGSWMRNLTVKTPTIAVTVRNPRVAAEAASAATEEEDEEERKRRENSGRDVRSGGSKGKRVFVLEIEEEDGGEMSDSSSDLFELENLTVIGKSDGGYNGELPVYETTSVETNRAIAQGLVC